MFTTVAIPLWLLVLILLFAAVTFASHFLFPSVRWFFRKRAERLVARLNQRLTRPIEPFKLARRHDMIQRLLYDPDVTRAIVEHAKAEGVPENVAFEQARRYAREIVPSFSATAYFTFGTRLASWMSRSLYRIRLGAFDRDRLEAIDPQAAVVFVINHRSNMDYFLVTYLAARAGALSYAVGEWARVWPLSTVIRMMGAFFIRRKSRGGLYRRILARYVQMATQGGVAQAVFPEGGLSLNGRLAPPKLGLLRYIISAYQPDGRAVIFVPVAVNYDRVIEDRILIAAGKAGERRFRPPLSTVTAALAEHLWQRITRRFKPFGTASVSFGEPLDLGPFIDTVKADLGTALGAEMMKRIAAVIPVLPVPLVARLMLAGAVTDRAELRIAVQGALDVLASRGVALPRRDAAKITSDALDILIKRKLVLEDANGLRAAPDAADVLGFYADSIAHHF
ncbi:MAG: glycerol-3-phosphate acyltransferase [Limimaricola sp.]|uniref:1-acyl-sn-glycerol-3-phosphate acyltransferase n=1 Tax=Limimaricola sp. TaxID=2211665 RepID=UPI001D59CEE2|nr:1-acyl-sn-glycerol-3-phosphate acyltransferase [Limimaricola sp.]MBI1417702.1 glycerol-3-phosphate acyltransferase [Limimaricola sp.]